MTKKIRCFCIILLMSMLVVSFNESFTQAATVKLNKSSLTLEVGKSEKLKMQGTKKKVTWSSKNKKIATVTSSGTVKAVKVGSTAIVAKVGKKNYSCKVTVLPVFQIDEDAIREELSGRKFSINEDSFQVQEDEIGEVNILSKARNKKNDLTQVIAEVEINRTIATMRSEVTLLYQRKTSSWKLKSVSEDTQVETWNLEGTWKGGVEVYDYSRNNSDYRDLKLDIFDVKSDGIFECEATFKNMISDSISMSGEIDEETGEIQMIGLDWIEDNSDLAQDLSERGKIYSFYGIADFANDAFVTDKSVSTRKTYTSDMVVEKQLEDDENEEEWEEDEEFVDDDESWEEIDEGDDVEDEENDEEENYEEDIYEDEEELEEDEDEEEFIYEE